MYAWLRHRLPVPLAEILVTLWYLLLLGLIAACAALPTAEFRYLNL